METVGPLLEEARVLYIKNLPHFVELKEKGLLYSNVQNNA